MSHQQVINVGSLPNDRTGDPLRIAFQKINDNFAELYSYSYQQAESLTLTNTDIVFQAPYFNSYSNFIYGSFQIHSIQIGTNNSQTVTIHVNMDNLNTVLKHNVYSSLFHNDIIIDDYTFTLNATTGNFELYANNISGTALWHSISYQLNYNTYEPSGYGLITEDGLFNIVTETTDAVLITE